MKAEGKTEEDIAEYLDKKVKHAIIGALIHPNPYYVEYKTLRAYGERHVRQARNKKK